MSKSYQEDKVYKMLENQFIYPSPKGSKLILASPSSSALRRRFFAPLGVGVNEENQ
jgi:hypothetical protein